MSKMGTKFEKGSMDFIEEENAQQMVNETCRVVLMDIMHEDFEYRIHEAAQKAGLPINYNERGQE